MSKIESSAGVITAPHQTYVSPLVFELYSNYCLASPDTSVDILEISEVTSLVCDKLSVKKTPNTHKKMADVIPSHTSSNNTTDVVLGFSGGLDSVYQALTLKEEGYNVILYHLRGINSYENGQGTARCRKIAEKIGAKYIETVIGKKKGWQQVPECPLKNELIMSLMIDYCLSEGVSKISMGDDLKLSLTDSVVGVNVTDAYELTTAFIDGIRGVVDIEFIPIRGGEKIDRIKKLMEWGLENDYYSCVCGGRFNKSLHERNEKKYGVRLFEGNCGCSCRKCAMHNLLLHYDGIKVFPQEFVDRCWKILWKNKHSADYEFFKPTLPLQERIKNLFEY